MLTSLVTSADTAESGRIINGLFTLPARWGS